MNPALVKIDVAAALLRLSAPALFELVEGSAKAHRRALVFVFNVAKRMGHRRRDLRFWLPEVQAHAQGEPGRFAVLELPDVIERILPLRRSGFSAGELDQLFQLRRRTRIDLQRELVGELGAAGYRYQRPTVAAFLERRWLGALVPGWCASRRPLGGSGVRRLISNGVEVEPGVSNGGNNSPGMPGESPPNDHERRPNAPS